MLQQVTDWLKDCGYGGALRPDGVRLSWRKRARRKPFKPSNHVQRLSAPPEGENDMTLPDLTMEQRGAIAMGEQLANILVRLGMMPPEEIQDVIDVLDEYQRDADDPDAERMAYYNIKDALIAFRDEARV